MPVFRLENTVQHYAWGSRELLPELMGVPNVENAPWAEIWMGAHPKAPSLLVDGNEKVPLNRYVRRNPDEVLGTQVHQRFGTVPFLFKYLAAGSPLSIQAHPSKAEAEKGFAEENAAGIPLDDPKRNYRDDNHKPEIICALTPFWALRGFRPPEEILKFAEELQAPEFLELVRLIPSEGLKGFFSRLMDYPEPETLAEAVAAAAADRPEDVYRWIGKISRQYPGDTGITAPLFLNLVELQPGEALFLPAGELHAYLNGLGIELMATSDNVLRGGLTVKHVDKKELLSVLTFKGAEAEVLHPQLHGEEEVYRTPASEFRLSRIAVSSSVDIESKNGCEILTCTEGKVAVNGLKLNPGEAVFVTADEKGYTMTGSGIVYRAAVPL